MMRRILVEDARKRGADKRGGGVTQVPIEDARPPAAVAMDFDVLALHEALTELESVDPRQCRIVELQYFVGLTIEETAAALGLSRATVKRDWRVAKLWLRRALERTP